LIARRPVKSMWAFPGESHREQLAAAKLIDPFFDERAVRRAGRSLEIEFEVAHGLGRIAGLGIGHTEAALALSILGIQLERL
jgi:hypothetical protein